MKMIVCLIILFFSYCRIHRQTPTPPFLNLVNEPCNVDTSRLRFNGFYDNATARKEMLFDVRGRPNHQKYCSVKPIYFFTNCKIMSRLASSLDSASHVNFLQHVDQEVYEDWGVFKITGDTIKAAFYYMFWKSEAFRNRSRIAYFQGIIKNRDTIMDWHLIKPYPEVNQEANINILKRIKGNSLLVFKYFPGKTVIDSTNLWINTLKNKTIP